MQLLDHHFVFGQELTVGDLVMQVEIESALADTVTGELAGVGRQGGQFDPFETGGDVQAGHRVERVDRTLDGHRRIAVDLAFDVDTGRFCLAAVDGADLPVELLNSSGEVRGQAEVGEVCRTIIDGYAANVDAQRFFSFSGCRFGRGGCGAGIGRLRDQQVINVGGAIIVDHEARIGLEQVDLVDRQTIAMLIVQAFEHQLLPLEEVAGLQGVEGMQLIDLGFTCDAERQRFGAFQVDRQITTQHAAAQFETNERVDVGLGDAQIDVLGLHVQFGADRGQIDHAICCYLALLAHAGVELEVER